MRISLFFVTWSLIAADPLIENGHWKRARDMAEAAYKANPNSAQANYWMARVQHEFRKFDEAAKHCEAAVRLDPKSSVYHRELGEIYADQADNVSFLRQLSLARKIRPEFDSALAIAPNDPDNLFDHLQYFEEAPGVVGGDKKKAAQVAADIMKVDPSRGYLALAYLAHKEKEDAKLEGYYQKAVEANPNNYEARTTLAGFYLDNRHENLAQAESQAKAAIDLNPDRINAYRLLTIALILQKRPDEAARVIARAEVAIPDDISPYYYAARAMLRLASDLPKAETYLKKYLNDTKEPEAGAPSFATGHWSLGLVYEKQGRKAEARSEMETAVKLKPDFEAAKRDLKRLK